MDLFIFVHLVILPFILNVPSYSYLPKSISPVTVNILLFYNLILKISPARYAKKPDPKSLFIVVHLASLPFILSVRHHRLPLKKKVIHTHSPCYGGKLRSFVMHVALRGIMFPTYVLHATFKSIKNAFHYHPSSKSHDITTPFCTTISFRKMSSKIGIVNFVIMK